jgi:hypothetical protein
MCCGRLGRNGRSLGIATFMESCLARHGVMKSVLILRISDQSAKVYEERCEKSAARWRDGGELKCWRLFTLTAYAATVM